MATLANDLAGTANDLTIGPMSYNPASQIVSQTRSNDLYAFTGLANGVTASAPNGLNQLASVGGGTPTYDPRGNMTGDPTTGRTYGYSSENMLTSASGGVTFAFDPTMRLAMIDSSIDTKFLYDGVNIIAEYNGASALQRRFVHGPWIDEPAVQYEGSGITDRRWLHSDERGSIVAVSDASGNMLSINRYDEYGMPQAANAGRFQYTGQMWLGELGLYYYKARMYAPHLGRFLQTDPIGYEDGMNWYVYVGNDPVNGSDPTGTAGIDGGLGWLMVTAAAAIGGDMRANPQSELNKRSYCWGGETAMTCAMSRDEQDYLNDNMEPEEVRANQQARALGTAAAGTAVVAGVAAGETGVLTALGATARSIGQRISSRLGRAARNALDDGGWANSNGYVRLGKGPLKVRVGNRTKTINMLRLSIGRKRAYNVMGHKFKIHWHWDIKRWRW